jgi:hypothetical protein
LAKNKKMNLMNYLFTVEDIANFCKENDILINVRGSAGGSFLLYLLGVSAVNPLKYNLSFERFLTLGRIDSGSLPDADIDVSAVEREKVFGYLENKYGDKFARIKIDTTLKLKSSIKDSERELNGEVSPATEKLCASLPNEVQGMSSYNLTFGYTDEDGNTHAGLIETNESLKQYAENNPKIWSTVKAMLGCKRQASVHPCYVGETLIYTIEGDRTLPVRLDQCDKKTILTGQGNQARAHLLVRGKKQVMEFTLENGTKLKATPDHPMLTENGWVPIIEVFQKGLSLVCPLPIANQTPLNGAENV